MVDQEKIDKLMIEMDGTENKCEQHKPRVEPLLGGWIRGFTRGPHLCVLQDSEREAAEKQPAFTIFILF